RLDPSPDVDAYWRRLTGNDTAILLLATEDDVRAAGRDPATAVQVPEEFGYGPRRYPAAPHTMHALHCLNALRKMAHGHADHDDDSIFATLHRRHCVDSLAELITCKASTAVTFFEWMEDWLVPYHDLRHQEECDDF
ncbi:uncharacterized protein M421DRAFT_29314, partial [Didymella exigua CBS 183.55]